MAQSLHRFPDGWDKDMESKIERVLEQLTLQEKVALCHAQSKFSSAGVPRLGIPENWMTDGPHGIRPEVLWDEWDQASWTNDSCIAFPALTCLAATWNEHMSQIYGKAIGEEARYRNKNVLLGPGVNIYRTPLNGRNFEYMGEDPFLASRMVVPYIKGVQSNGVAACVKHFALNNQEINRHGVNVIVDDRTLYEIYLPAFKASVQEGGAWAIMGAYNKYRNQYCCHNDYLLNDILRKEWGFDGVVVSDWGGVMDTREAALYGLDMEFGTWTDGLTEGLSNAYDSYYLAQPFLKMLQSGELSEDVVNEKARNILRLIYRTNLNPHRPLGSFGTEEHALVGRQIAEEGIVLLKNDKKTLPFNISIGTHILVVGENAIKPMTVGGGSSSLKAKYEVSPLDGIKARVGDNAKVTFARGYVGDVLTVQDGLRSSTDLSDNRSKEELISEAVSAAKDADVVIFVGGLNKSSGQDSESNDRASLGLPYGQDDLIEALVKANSNLLVVNISGNAVSMPWVKSVPAILQGWFLGTEAGNALASVIFGDTNPSGKLPFSFYAQLDDNGAHALNAYPGGDDVEYKEGLFVGYRWLDKHNIKPLFSFGHGLSYTSFSFGKAIADKKTMQIDDTIEFKVSVKNTGSVAGAEVIQLYVEDVKSSLPRPIKELKSFRKVWLEPGEEQVVSMTLSKEDLSFFDDIKHEWVAEPGDFIAHIGNSSTNIKSKVRFVLE
nr:glycoside hydrolase family 3 C-terminal domain-containing protein [Bacteroides propionicifaciens]